MAGECLDDFGGSPASGTTVELWDGNGGCNQIWRVSRGQR
jgi:hypothetical protein